MRKPKLIRSRDAMRARGMAYNASNLRRASSRHAYAGGGTGFGSIMLCDKSVARVKQRETRDGHFKLYDRPRVSRSLSSGRPLRGRTCWFNSG